MRSCRMSNSSASSDSFSVDPYLLSEIGEQNYDYNKLISNHGSAGCGDVQE